MAIDGVRFLVQGRKLGIRTIRMSSRSVRNHPFYVGAFLFVVFLYRSSPFLFSFLVSASPVLVCTAVLLGTLLSFGHPQIPQIEKDEKISSEISSLRAAAAESTTIFQKEAVLFGRVDGYTETRSQISAEKDIEEATLLGEVCSVSKIKQGTLSPQSSQEIVFEQQSVEETNTENKNRDIEIAKENHDKSLRFEGSTDDVQSRKFENDRSAEGSVDGQTDDHFESSSVPWTQVNGDHGDDDDEDEASDSGSDGAESSSPDPSMADIIPLLDELHPLIECEDPLPVSLSCENSGLLSNRSHNLHDSSSINSDGETDHKEVEEEEAGDDDDDEENQGDKDDAEKSAITWTKDDQKNLMDLGSSELERNQRLESLIARRRTRRNMSVMTERNLIDLDGFDLPFQVPPISTTRQNPFDFPNDTYDNMAVPPIPGSAPSILLPRRNPFDLPYDSNEEKPDLVDDSFPQEFMQPNLKEPVFRRHESFHIGSSFFDFPRQEGQDANHTSRFRTYFIPQRLPSEGNYSSFIRQSSEISESSSFQRQTSELSETSCFHRQTSGLSESSSFHRQSSDMSESKASSAAETEPVSAEVDQEGIELNVHDSTEERIPDSEIDHASLLVERGSQSSNDFYDQFEKRDFDLNMPEIRLGELNTDTATEFHQSERGHIIETNLGSIASNSKIDSWMSAGNISGEIHLMEKPVKEKHYGNSSSSSSEEHNDVKELDEELVKGEEIGFHLIDKSVVQTEKLIEAANFHHDHCGHTHSAERSTFGATMTLETIEEEHISSLSSSLVLEEHNNSEGVKLSEALENMERISSNIVNNSHVPTEQALDESNIGHCMDVMDSHSKDPVYDSNAQAAKNFLSISSEHRVEEFSDHGVKDLKWERDGLLGRNDGVSDAGVHPGVVEKVCDISSDYQYTTSSNDLNLSSIKDWHNDAVAEHSCSAEVDLLSPATELTEEPKLFDEETTSHPENLVDVLGNVEGKQISVADKGYLKDGCLINPPSDNEEESSVNPEKLEEASSANKLHREDSIEMNDLSNLSLQTIGTSNRVQESRQEHVTAFFDFRVCVEERSEIESPSPIVGDAETKSQFGESVVPDEIMSDEIKDMEESLLSELDAVGDFYVKDVGMGLNQDTLRVEKANGFPVPEATFINKIEIVENAEAGTDGLPDSRASESKTWFQVLEPESSENIEKSSDQNTKKYSADVFLINRSETKVENDDAGIDDFPDSHVSESKTWFQVMEPESSEDFEKSSDEDAEESSSDVLLINRSETKVENDEAGMDEFPASSMLESETTVHILQPESIENTEQSNDENAEQSAPEVIFSNEVEHNVKNAEAGMDEFLDPQMLEGRTSFLVLGAESRKNIEESSNENPEIFGNTKSLRLQDELPRGETEIGFTKDSESAIRTDEPLTFHGNTNWLEKDEPDVEISGSASSMEEIKRSAVAGTDASSDAPVLKSNTVIEKDEPSAAEISLSAPSMEERVQSSAIDRIDESSEPHLLKSNSVIDKDETSAAEISGSVPLMEEEVQSSAVDSIDVSSEPRLLKSGSVNDKDETSAAEISGSSLAGIDASSNPHVCLNAVIEEDELSPAEISGPAPPMEEEIERSTVATTGAHSNSHVFNSNTGIEKDERSVGGEVVVETNRKDALDNESHKAESPTDVVIAQFEAEQPTSRRVPYDPAISSSLHLESIGFQPLHVEDHQPGQPKISVGHLETSPDSISAPEKSDCLGSGKVAPETPNKEEE